LALATIILNKHLDSDLAYVLTTSQINDLRKSINAVQGFTPVQVAAVSMSFSNAFKSQFQSCMGVAAVSLVVALCAWQRHPPTVASQRELEKREAEESTVEDRSEV